MYSFNSRVLIDAPVDEVWKFMFEKETYERWVEGWSGRSTYEGAWEEGSVMKLFDAENGGTVTRLDSVVLNESIKATHIAMLTKEMVQDTTSDTAVKWCGLQEHYYFEADQGKTTLIVVMKEVHEQFVFALQSVWKERVAMIKELVETPIPVSTDTVQ